MLNEISLPTLSTELGIPEYELREALGRPNAGEADLQRRLSRANRPADIMHICTLTLVGSSLEMRALAKLLHVASDPKEARYVYNHASTGSDLRNRAIRKLVHLHQQQPTPA
ncbi:MAG TPA: hypothetical protein VJH94_02115 [Candidatus Paceibacterota bacterium]